ncbi:serine/threonine-protein kinase 3-like isoform X3 [Portunus trituberculatus]|uniref:serine/threonine-protein kinase 3-like isoform X3 n=1 Tax=Portunus trituberculatus TaxID=210409 RepID=UPI001E1CBC6A|nr:serine/threonine-protein kinase 3-like isoform X3 [Portunus trituberculatus]
MIRGPLPVCACLGPTFPLTEGGPVGEHRTTTTTTTITTIMTTLETKDSTTSNTTNTTSTTSSTPPHQDNSTSESHTKHCEEQNENGELVKLSEESLMRQPEEVFDIICKLGEGSYGSVYKALHKESGQVLAIKQVPIDTDLQEIIKEISIMQQCDSHHVVKYYGSYFKDSDLWIVMEYCGAGSVSDIMRLRKKTLTEEEIATVVYDTLRGLEYLHLRRKIHRDIKAGNILLNTQGHAKLADFGVAGQLSDTMAKRNTVIGTPFWMAPEVIQEIGYDCVADIWSLGITALEMAEGKPPYGDIHPMRAIFMIPTKPPPSFREPDQWQPEFIDFVSRCLVKNPEERATATELLQHPFIRGAQPSSILRTMLEEAMEIRESQNANRQNQIKHITESQVAQLQLPSPGTQMEQDNRNNQHNQMHHQPPPPLSHHHHHNHHHNLHHHNLVNTEMQDDDEVDSSTMVRYSSGDSGTLRPLPSDGTLRAPVDDGGTLRALGGGTGTLSTDLGTMVINSDNEEEDEDSTMKRHDTAPGERVDRPLFLDYFDKKEQEKKARSKGVKDNSSSSPQQAVSPPQQYVGTGRPIVSQQHPAMQSSQVTVDDKHLAQQHQAHLPQQSAQPSTIQPQQLHLNQQQQQQQQLQQQHAQQKSQQQLQQQQQQQQAQQQQQPPQQQYPTGEGTMVYSPPAVVHPQPKPLSAEERRKFENDLQRQLVQMNNPAHHRPPPARGVAAENQPKFQRSFIDGDFDFLKHLTYEELHQRMATLDQEMEREIDELRQRYQAKRQPILDAMDQKRKRQQNF